MDIITQGLLGATMAQSGAKNNEARMATGIGFFSGILADADIFIQSSNDPLLNVEFHRHFTHSIFFVPFGALIASCILWFFLRKRLPFNRIYIFSLLGYCLSGVLDAFTSYGTHLLWPINDSRIAFNSISVIDPIFTLILLTAVIYTFKKKVIAAAWVGLLLAAVYLSFGLIQHERVTTIAQALAHERGHETERLMVKPTLGNLILWRSIYQSGDTLYVDAIRAGLFSETKIYTGNSIKKFIMGQDIKGLPASSILANDISRFTAFSAGLVAIHPNQPNLLIDVRYSNLPTTITPLWAIEIDRSNPDKHAQFKLYRDSSKENREQFIALLLGKL